MEDTVTKIIVFRIDNRFCTFAVRSTWNAEEAPIPRNTTDGKPKEKYSQNKFMDNASKEADMAYQQGS